MKKLFLLAIVALGFTAVSFGQVNGSINANASASVKDALTIVENTALSFGSFIVSPTLAGNVVVDATTTTVTNGTRITSGTRGAFTITGPASHIIDVAMPLGDVTLSKGGDDMTILAGNFSAPATITTNASGSGTLVIGARLDFIGGQAAGDYTGLYEVKISYN